MELAKDEMAVHHVTVIGRLAKAIVRDVTARDHHVTEIARRAKATVRDAMARDRHVTEIVHRVRIRNDLLMMPCGSMRTVTESWTERNFGHLLKKWDTVTDRQAMARRVKAVRMAPVVEATSRDAHHVRQKAAVTVLSDHLPNSWGL